VTLHILCLLKSIEGVDINNGFGKGLQSLLRQIVPYVAGDVAMLVPAGVLLGVDARSAFAMPGVVYKKVRSQHWTSIDIGLKPNLDNPAVKALLSIVRGQFSKRRPDSVPGRTGE